MSDASPDMAMVLAIGTAIFLIPFALLFAKLFDGREQVRIDQGGLMVRAHSLRPIPLRSLSGLAQRGGRVVFGLTKPEKHPIETALRRIIWKANGAQASAYFGNVWIWTTMLDCSYIDIQNAIHTFRPVTDYEQKLREKGASARSDIAPRRL